MWNDICKEFIFDKSMFVYLGGRNVLIFEFVKFFFEVIGGWSGFCERLL